MDKYTLALINEIIECKDIELFDQLNDKVTKDIEDGQFDSDLEEVLLKVALLSKGNNLVNNFLEGMGDNMSIIITADPSEMFDDPEEVRLAEMKDDELNDVKDGNVYNIGSIRKPKKDKE